MSDQQGEQRSPDDERTNASIESDAARESVTEDSQVDDGPGCLPAVMAATVLMGIVGFIACGFSTWMLFNKRSELAVRTIRATYIPDIEQSYLAPDEKQAIVKQLDEFAAALERGEHENWQAAGVMQRLQRTPVLQWGELAVVEAFLQKSDDANADASRLQLSRLRRAIEMDQATSFDFEDVLRPATEADDSSSMGRRLVEPLTQQIVDEVVQLAKLVADRSEVPDQEFPDVRIDSIVRRQIEQGITAGGF